MKARRKSDGQWVDVYHYGYIDFGKTNIYKEFNSDNEYKEKELVFEDTEIVNSYWFNFRNQAAMAAMQGMLANNGLILEDGDTYPKIAVRYADVLVEELQKKTD